MLRARSRGPGLYILISLLLLGTLGAHFGAAQSGDSVGGARPDGGLHSAETQAIAAPPAHPVIVGIPDSGINPYHELFHRPGLTMHPCTYIADFPCDVEALELSIGVYSTYGEAVEADLEIWESVQVGKWYWIPNTVFVAAYCQSIYSGPHCILDSHGHGTGTTSSVLTENPGALIAFKEGLSSIAPFVSGGIPVDVFSVSWGNVVPVPGHPEIFCANHERSPIFVTAAGNDPRSTLLDCRKGDPALITVGGASAQDGTEEVLAAKHPEVVSYFCRPTALHESLDEWRPSYCGTSFSAPTVAGALSKVIQAVRESSGYSGGLVGDFIDPVAGVTIQDLRDALNRTASYAPEPQYPNSTIGGIPKVEQAPWLQWGWGFYDGLVADTTINHILGIQKAPEKPPEAHFYMETLYLAKRTLYGPLP